MNSESRNKVMLASAKANLEKMAYFGITDDQRTSQYLFEVTFNLRFNTVLGQYNITHSAETAETLTPDTLDRIVKLNRLDHELYLFGQQLLEQRFLTMQETVEYSYIR